MNIGIPREIKPGEGRVALMPRHVKALSDAGHMVMVETAAGRLSGVKDQEYRDAGASIARSGKEVFDYATAIVKVKEILPEEYAYLRSDHIIFTNIHAALNREQLDRFLEVGLTAISAENTHPYGSPNCALAGEIGALEGVRLSLAPYGGTGRHFMGHFDQDSSLAVVIGLGNVGRGALRTLLSLGVRVVGLDINEGARKAAVMDWFRHDLKVAHIDALPDFLSDADMIINCVLWPKERDDHLISRDMLVKLKSSAVIIDISCDTGGAVETCRPTTWDNPVYEVDGIRQ
ncbi:NAD(P)-dependent oxidoreductase, partial [Desulfobacterales bacterium HSG16]|nr:NAD(P)-dependent oxidoreductase [Desulfobacterales bacterium HSG16]